MSKKLLVLFVLILCFCLMLILSSFAFLINQGYLFTHDGIVKSVGQTEQDFHIVRINFGSVDGNSLGYFPFNVGSYDPSSLPITTLHIGDEVGRTCDGTKERIVFIDPFANTVTFNKEPTNYIPSPDTCPI